VDTSSHEDFPQLNTVEGFYFDTRNIISAYAELETINPVMQRCSYYNDLLSKTVPGSDVWKINHAGGEPVQVSAHTLQILQTAASVSEASQGAFNIAIGQAVSLWRFKDQQPRLPDPQALADAVARADYRKIELDGDLVRVPADMQIDLGGIAKGYIADCIADELRELGVTSALLNFGGNVITIGGKPDGSAWQVGLQTPAGKRGADFWAAVPSRDSTVVTSGMYERGFDIDGVRYHHILDPRTGWPIQNGLLTVTACTKSSLLADVLTTAIFVLGAEAGMQLANQFGVQAVLLFKDGKVTYSSGLDIVFVRPKD
jgi:thiamine biosynthesis lipoprotein